MEIENYLPLLSKKGSGDDITLVLAVQIDDAKIQSILNYLRGTKLYKNGQKEIVNSDNVRQVMPTINKAKSKFTNIVLKLMKRNQISGIYSVVKMKSVIKGGK